MIFKKALNKINLPSRASLGYIGAGVIGKAVGLITTPFFTSYIDKDGYGILTLYMTILGACSIIISSFTSSGAIYDAFKRFERNIREFTASALSLSFVFSLLICLLLFTFNGILGLSPYLILILSLQILCDTITGVLLSRSRFKYSYFEVILCTVIASVVSPLVSIFILMRFGGGYEIKIYSLLVISLIISISLLARESLNPAKPSIKMAKSLFKKALPLIPKSASSALLSGADKLLISSFMGYAALAKYSVAHSVGIALQFVVSASSSALSPWIIRRLEAKEEGRIREICALIFSILCAMSLGISAIAPEAIDFLAPRDYVEASAAILPIALSVPISFLCYTISLSLVKNDTGGFSAVASIISSICCVGFNILFIPSFGFIGAGCALLLSELITLALSILFTNKIGLGYVIPQKWYVVYSLSALLGVGIMMFQKFLAIRIFLLIIPAVIGLNGLLKAKEMIKER